MTSSCSSSSGSACIHPLPMQQPMTIGQKYACGNGRRHHRRNQFPLPTPRTVRQRSCLRKESAFTCDGAARGSRLDELSATKVITVSYSAEPKKRLSFADQRGQHLVLERAFSPTDAPMCYCDVPIEVTVRRFARQRGVQHRLATYQTASARQTCAEVVSAVANRVDPPTWMVDQLGLGSVLLLM
jgi:hypothetical protein